MKVPVINIKGKTTGREVELSNKVFGIEPNDHAVYLDVKQFLANQRQGNAKTKERAEIKGSTRKIKKQKGTGMTLPLIYAINNVEKKEKKWLISCSREKNC